MSNDSKNNSRPQMGPGRHGPNGMAFKSKPKNLKKTLGRLLKYISNFKVQFILLLVFAVIFTGFSLASNVFIEKVVAAMGSYDKGNDAWIVIPDKQKFITSLIILSVVLVMYCLFNYLSSLMGAKLTVNVTKKLRNDLFNKVVKLPIGYIDTHPHGDIMSRIINDVDNVSNAISSSVSSFISGLIQIIGCLVIMLLYSPLLTLVTLISLVLTVILTMTLSKKMGPLYRTQQKVLGSLNAEAEEMITGCKTVMAYNRQEKAMRDFNEKSNYITKVGTKAQIIGGSMGPVMNFIGNVGFFLVCIFGALFVIKGIGGGIKGVLTASVVVMFLNTVKQFNRPINEIAQLYSAILSAIAGAERIFDVLDEKEENFEGKREFHPDMIKGIIDFNHIGFSYVEGKPILKDFNVDVRSGHKIALVGATGSGKTTIVNLLLRFYDVTTGKITIDGIDIADISKKDLRSAISIVLQDPVLFGDSIENNVKYGKDDATDEEVDAALEFANCKKFVNRLPEGKKTILTEGATNISQGQRQLLTIARAVLADPKILILDEATSSVDTRTEKKIQDAMVKLMENRTSIIIAHRLSTIQDADLIVVLSDGHVVEMGNHNELLEKHGIYDKLYQTQFSGAEI